ncbi:MAPEG family protein [Paracoccus sp. JM45]|uniref:MAPEG family protein n=1 Tax=Paracoccus sp. JM45 TaxID=2283626 RepID=UPI000E6BB442|nr:MAPEG family protein [Paracoccus sp. JM45]RJE81372.1 MAPEG family protein [Paracoccus sp. JM45]
MPAEVTALALAGLLQVAQFATYSVVAQRQVGRAAALSPRDNISTQLTGRAGRLQRAFNNHFEGLIMFTLAVVVVTIGDASSGLTAVCAWVYLLARILYVPAYVLGWVPWRSVIWAVGFAATVVMIVAALF